jgi:hypothetical protein
MKKQPPRPEPKFSTIPIILEREDDWLEVARLTGGWLSEDGIARLTQALAGQCRTVVIEMVYVDRDYRNTFSNFHSTRFQPPPPICRRLHFFAAELSELSRVELEKCAEAYLGYSIVRPTRPNCIGRTLIRPPDCFQDQWSVRLCKEEVNFWGAKLAVHGFPFISQDTDVTCCAQSALWMLLRYYSNSYHTYKERHPHEIGLLTSEIQTTRLFPTTGLTTEEIAFALRRGGLGPVIYNRKDHKQDFDALLFTYIESGIPLLVCFKDHVVAAFGTVPRIGKRPRTLVEPTVKRPGARAAGLWDGILINDDNSAPYSVLPFNVRRQFEKPHIVSDYRPRHIECFVVPLADRIHLPADEFDRVVRKTLRDPTIGLRAHAPDLRAMGRSLIRRDFLTTGRSFKRSLTRRDGMDNTVKRKLLDTPMPHFVWVSELWDAARYGADRPVLGELIRDATCNGDELDGWIALHYPRTLIFPSRSPTLDKRHKGEAITLEAVRGARQYYAPHSNLKRKWTPPWLE